MGKTGRNHPIPMPLAKSYGVPDLVYLHVSLSRVSACELSQIGQGCSTHNRLTPITTENSARRRGAILAKLALFKQHDLTRFLCCLTVLMLCNGRREFADVTGSQLAIR